MTTTVSAPEAPLTVVSVIEKYLPLASVRKKEKLEQCFCGKRDVKILKEDIIKLKAHLIYQDERAQDLAADVLLGTITLGAAQKRLRIEKNFSSVLQFKGTLSLDEKVLTLLADAYASPSSPMFFDDEMTAALAEVQTMKNVEGDYKKALAAVELLKQKARLLGKSSEKEQETELEEISKKYSLNLKLRTDLKEIFCTNPYSKLKEQFHKNFNMLEEANRNEPLNAALAAKTMLCQITAEDALEITLLAKEIKYPLLEEDLTAIGVRYLRSKGIKDISATLDALLKRLAFYEVKEENLGLAVRVLLDGTKDALDHAEEKAKKFKARALFRAGLSKHECFNGYVFEIAKKFTGEISLDGLLEKYGKILSTFAYCSDVSENWDLACKLLLGKITEADALEQALYRRDLKAQTLIHGLAPECLKKYLGTDSPEEVTKYLESTLKGYSFWQKDEEKHLYAQQAVVAELNGMWGAGVTQYILKDLEGGNSVLNIQNHLTFLGSKEVAKMSFAEISKAGVNFK